MQLQEFNLVTASFYSVDSAFRLEVILYVDHNNKQGFTF